MKLVNSATKSTSMCPFIELWGDIQFQIFLAQLPNPLGDQTYWAFAVLSSIKPLLTFDRVSLEVVPQSADGNYLWMPMYPFIGSESWLLSRLDLCNILVFEHFLCPSPLMLRRHLRKSINKSQGFPLSCLTQEGWAQQVLQLFKNLFAFVIPGLGFPQYFEQR